MVGQVTSADFTGVFAYLNGTVPITANRADIIRSLLTVGYRNRQSAARIVGPWRERMLVAMATGYLERDLCTTKYFRNLEQSEKVGTSFLLGEAFTHWYAQSMMKIKFLIHAGALNSHRWTPSSTLVLKAKATPPAPKSRPDFIGVNRRQRHVFESKGRSRRPSSSAIGKALGQVSAIHSINGRVPVTRCASFLMLKANGPEAQVYDPPSDGEGFALSFNILEAIFRYYSFFVDGPVDNIPSDIISGYVGRRIEDGLYFGLDKRIFEAIQAPPASRRFRARTATIFSILEEESAAYQARRTPESSPGIDGTILIDLRGPQGRVRTPAKTPKVG